MLKFFTIIIMMLLINCASRQTADLRTQQEKAPQIVFQGGDGGSIDDAVVIIGVSKQDEGLEAEYGFISKKYGLKGKDWRVVGQTIVKENKKIYDMIEFEIISSSERRIYYFDVSAFPWKN